jgi:TIR domain
VPGEVLLQLEMSPGAVCQVVSGLPTDETVRLTIATAASAAARTKSDANLLYDRIADELVGLGGQCAAPACGGTYRGTGNCMADSTAPRDHNVLIVVEDLGCDIDPRLPAAFQRFPSHVVLPIAQANTRGTPSPSITHLVMLKYDPGAIEKLIPEILAQGRIGTDAFRIFISYKHDDCMQAAQALFHRLAEARFAVFLDRFCGDPGQDFVARITSELFEKSCLLVLETPTIASSTWVMTEVATAQTHRLGLLAVDLPGSVRSLPITPRLDCTSSNGGIPLGRNGTLQSSEVERVVEFVRQNMAAQGARRRRWQRRNLREAVRRSKIGDQGETLLGRRLRGSQGSEYHAILNARPPGASSFKRARDASGQSEQPILFGPLSHQLPGDTELTSRLGNVSRVLVFDEGTMLATLRAADSGVL